MAELKTKLNDGNVDDFLNQVEDDQKKKDCLYLKNLMEEISQKQPKMWGNSIVGFGSYHFKYDSGREGDWFLTGFSPRKQSLTIYIMNGFEREKELMGKLGKHSTGKSCLYIKRLEDVDKSILRELVERSVKYMNDKYNS